MNVCLLSACSFPPVLTPFYRGQRSQWVKLWQVLCKLGTAECRTHSSATLAMGTELPARCCRHKGRAGLMVDGSWEADSEAGETETHRTWVLSSFAAWRPTCYWFIQWFSSQFLSSTENYFSCQWCFPGTGWSACFKTPDSIIYLLNKRAQQTSFFLCFALTLLMPFQWTMSQIPPFIALKSV